MTKMAVLSHNVTVPDALSKHRFFRLFLWVYSRKTCQSNFMLPSQWSMSTCNDEMKIYWQLWTKMAKLLSLSGIFFVDLVKTDKPTKFHVAELNWLWVPDILNNPKETLKWWKKRTKNCRFNQKKKVQFLCLFRHIVLRLFLFTKTHR